MFIPEYVNEARGEYVLVANHWLGSDEAVALSIDYNRARIAFGVSQMPAHVRACRLVYDLRGQVIDGSTPERIQGALAGLCTLEFMR